jgi:leucyl aminopeptidase (aminopeptidase T)
MGFAVDPRRIELLAEALRGRIGPASEIRVRSAGGTDLTVRCHPKRRWIEHTGVIRRGMKENLPAGVMETCPGEVEGVFVADGSLGDGNGDLHAVLSEHPMRLHISGGTVSRFECGNEALLTDVTNLAQKSAYLDRVGLVGFGINTGMTSLAGDIFTDQKTPGFHLSLGMTFPPLTGATWSATNWIAFTGLGADVQIDGVDVLKSGTWVIA